MKRGIKMVEEFRKILETSYDVSLSNVSDFVICSMMIVAILILCTGLYKLIVGVNITNIIKRKIV